MEYLLGIAVGMVYGGTVGVLKYLLLWKKMLNHRDNTITMKMVYKRIMLSFAINALTLLATLLFKDFKTIDFVSLAVAAAVALSITGRLFSIQKVLKNTTIKEDDTQA